MRPAGTLKRRQHGPSSGATGGRLPQGTRAELADRRPGRPPQTAEWVKHNLSRIRDSLPNGYCGRPPQQTCPHPNACLTCPDFQTTPEFLDIHRRQHAANLRLITRADANGQPRLTASLRQVQANLDKIIPALETLRPYQQEAGNDPD